MNLSQPIAPIATSCLVLCASLAFVEPSSAHDTDRGYIVMGDSIDYGIGASSPGKAYVPQFHAYIESAVFLQQADLHNLAVPGATARDIKQGQLTQARTETIIHNQRVISWGGGNDLLQFINSPEAAACMKGNISCLARLNALLNEFEQTADHALRNLRDAAGPSTPIYVRTQYNPLMKAACGGPTFPLAQLANAVLEGSPSPRLDRGMNARLRELAHKYNAKVIDTFLPFYLNADTLIDSDCVHPNDAGYAAILAAAVYAYTP
ncbi:MAG TPA: GDSL-type esterase/lipase family protein [Nitrospira sp.]|nr:GDSL-type esterase/lipase family protein [Nitrospira sp.]